MSEPTADQHFTLSYSDVLANPNVRIIAISRFMAQMAGSTMTFGVMVFLAIGGASQFQVSLASAAAFLASLLFGLQGGLLADSSPKRTVIGLGFAFQAALCFFIPFVLGTTFGPLLLLIFVTSAISQVVSPGLKSIVAIVSTPAQVATTGALVMVVGSIGSALGSAFLAPLIINLASIQWVLFAAGIFYLISAIRIFRLPTAEKSGARSLAGNLRGINWKPQALSLDYNARWIMEHRALASMLLIGILVGALFEGLNTLLPIYVRDVLDMNPALSIYIFAPAGIGYLIGALGGPRLIHRLGERRLAVVSLVFMMVGTLMLGFIGLVAPVLAPLSPLRLLEPLVGMTFSDKVLAAGVAVIPANFGSTAAGEAVQVYVNRRLPPVRQGAIFGLEQVQQNAFNLVAVFSLGLLATVTGPQYIFALAPVLLGILMLALVRYSFRAVGASDPDLRGRVQFLTEAQPEDEQILDVPPD